MERDRVMLMMLMGRGLKWNGMEWNGTRGIEVVVKINVRGLFLVAYNNNNQPTNQPRKQSYEQQELDLLVLLRATITLQEETIQT
jgi:hypothetical protein